MRSKIVGCLIVSVIASLTCSADYKGLPAIVPKPVKMQVMQGKGFSLQPTTNITYSSKGAKDTAELLAEFLKGATGFDLTVKQEGGAV